VSEFAQPKLSYRADIDGLRAVAVLLVVANHFKIARLSGGYVGVDVFFVISGYLISSIILRQIGDSSFSISKFYEHRIRRIVPAMLAMMFVTCVFSYIYLLPTELVEFSKSLLASILSVSNLFFLTQAGYFDAPSATKPLLHMWSLAVEEQFYIVFPPFLLLLRRFFPGRLRLAILSFAAISFVWAAVGAFVAPSATFFLTPTRAWELLAGTLLSMQIVPVLRSRVSREVAGAVGLVLIFGAAFSFTPSTDFPGAAALLPCVGACLVIAAGHAGPSTAGRMLSLKPVVFIGTISYSIYLWHWPVLVFQAVAGILGGGGTGRAPKVIGFCVSMLLGYLSWRWVEVPFRKGRLQLTGATLFRTAAGAGLTMTVLAGAMLITHGFRARFSDEAVRVGSYLEYKFPAREGTCFIVGREVYGQYDASSCLREDAGRKNYLLVGDSHAAHLWSGLSAAYPEANIMQATASGCRPVLHAAGAVPCVKIMNFVFSEFLATHHVDKLLLAGHWIDGDLAGLGETVAWAKSRGIDVVVFGPAIEYDTGLPRLLAVSLTKDDPEFAFHHLLPVAKEMDEKMQRLADMDWHVKYVSYYKLLCPAGPCVEYADGKVPLEFDATHLTQAGSVLVAERISQSKLLQ
jgi:peptidoglycan/LPS O-acetylase OafA/YrhL